MSNEERNLEDRNYVHIVPVVKIATITAYEWLCPQCNEWHDRKDWPEDDTVECIECDSEFKYE